MACDLTLGRKEPCKDSVGGIQTVYFISWTDIDSVTITYDATDTDMIDQIVASADSVNAYKYELKGSSSLDQAVTSSRENGTTYFEQTLTLSLKKLTKEDHKELKLLTYNRPLAVVEDRNNNLFLCGLDHGMDVNGGNIATGTALGDFSGYNLTLVGMEQVPANFCVVAGADGDAKMANLGLTVVQGTNS